MKVLKFGGTSMGSISSLQIVSDIIIKSHKDSDGVLIVCSAMSGITDKLIDMGSIAMLGKTTEALRSFADMKTLHTDVTDHYKLDFDESLGALFQELENLIRGISMIRELSERSSAVLTSFGERISTRLLTGILKKNGQKAKQCDSFFVKTQGLNYGEDEVDWNATEVSIRNNLESVIQSGRIPVITGFFGQNPDGVIALLGRGGSDFSAAVVAVSMGIKVVEIWTDVSGFMSADPRIVKDAEILSEIGFEEVSELCFFGAKVLHPKTIRPVTDHGGEVWIKNTFEENAPGTRIAKDVAPSKKAVLSISSKAVTLINLDLIAMPTHLRKSQILGQLFSFIEKNKICVDMVASSETQFSLAVSTKGQDLENFLENLKTFGKIGVSNNYSVVAIVSPKEVKDMVGIASKIFQAITDSGVSLRMYSQNMSEIAQLVVVENNRVKDVIKGVHKELISK